MSGDREAIGIYGKLPTQGDFVRHNASDPAAQALDQWVQESLEGLARASIELPAEPLFFCHQSQHPSLPALLGAMTPSHDQVGRRYPMLVFVRVDPTIAASRFPALHVAYGHFLLDAARILGDLHRADASLLAAWSRSLRLPTPTSLAHSDYVCRHVLDQSTLVDLQHRVFGPAPQHLGALGYALKTVADACDATRARPSKVPITLDCPTGSDLDAFTWLDSCGVACTAPRRGPTSCGARATLPGCSSRSAPRPPRCCDSFCARATPRPTSGRCVRNGPRPWRPPGLRSGRTIARPWRLRRCRWSTC